MEYTLFVHKDESSGLWCARKHYSNGTVGNDYAFATSVGIVLHKLDEDDENPENITVEN